MNEKCKYCEGPAYKTNGKAELICRNRAYYGSCEGLVPRKAEKQQGRNEKCNCGSGVKFKNCCYRIIVETI